MLPEREQRRSEVPSVFEEEGFRVTQRVGEFIDAYHRGERPEKERFLDGLSPAFQSQFLERVELFEAIQTVKRRRTAGDHTTTN